MNRTTVNEAAVSFLCAPRLFPAALFTFILLVWLLGPNALVLKAQQGDPEDPLLNIGIPPIGLTVPIQSGYVNAANGQPIIEIPLASIPQRTGPPVMIKLAASGTDWGVLTNGINAWVTGADFPGPAFNIETSPGDGIGGWSGGDGLGNICNLDGVEEWDTFGGFQYYENGTTHRFPLTTTLVNTSSQCHFTHTDVPNADGLALDGSGYHIYVVEYTVVSAVYAPDGTLVYSCPSGSCLNFVREDSNGNKITWVEHTQPPYDVPITDMENRTLVTTTVNGNTTTYAVLNSKGGSSGTSSYIVTSTSINVHTNFHGTTTNTAPDCTCTVQVTQSVQLPDGTSYSFKYDCDSTAQPQNPVCGSLGGQGAYYGDLISMTLPTGGQIQYKYGNFIDAEGSFVVGGIVRTHITRGITQMTTPDGTWGFTPLVVSSSLTEQQLTVTKPGAEKEVHMVRLYGGVWPYETDYYDAAGNLDASLTATYDYSNLCTLAQQHEGICLNNSAIYVNNLTKTITLPEPGGNVSTTTGFMWDPAHTGNVTLKSEWNFGSSTSGSADRTTTYAYLSSPNVHITDRPTTITVKNSGAAIIAQTINCYDGSTTSPCNYSSAPASATNKTQHDDTAYPVSYTSRGNLTQVLKLISGTSNYISTSRAVYDMTGQVVSSLDSNGNQTSYDYTDNYFDDTGDSANPTGTHSVGQATNAYLKTITYATVNSVTLKKTFGYYWGTGKKASSIDPNSQSSYFHFFDPYGLDRPTSTHLPDNGWAFTSYSSSERQIDTGLGITGTNPTTSCSAVAGDCRHDEAQLDSLGRTQYQILVSDPDGQATVYTTYDSNGRVHSISNPYRSGSSSTDGTESFSYDGLDRAILVTRPDGNGAYTSYGTLVTSNGGRGSQICSGYGVGYPILSKDESSKLRQTWTDGFGRLIEVDEPDPSTGSLTSGAVAGTCYAYDWNDNLIGVQQPTGEATCTLNAATYNRCFTYDMLSRLTAATNPESGTINYYYTTTGGPLCAGDISAVCRRTDARAITTTYSYDALNRIISKTYSDSTPGAFYSYDQTSPWGFTLANPLGRLTTTGTTTGSAWITESAYSYDAMGRLILEVPCIGTNCISAYFTYDLAGDMNAVLYPSLRYVTSKYSGAIRPAQVTFASFNNTPVGYNYLSSATYAPTGAPTSMTLGSGVIETDCYNSRLQPGSLQIASGSFTWLNRTYNFYPSGTGGCTAGSGGNNGNVMQIADNIQTIRTQTFGYDYLNRISTAQTQGTSGPDCWGESFGYDALANLKSETAILTGCPMTQLSVGVNAQNQITNPGFHYDAAGNLLTDGNNNYTYDAENRIITLNVNAAVYTYDAQGQRVFKQIGSNTTEYVYYKGQSIAESNASGVWTDYIFAGTRRLALSVGTNENFITNGSFEQGLTNWGTWGTATMVNNTSNAHSGSNYVQISASSGGYSGVNNQTIPVKPGDQITFGGWVNLQSGSSTSPGWVLAVYNSSLTAIANIASPTPPSSKWMYQSVNYTVPAGGAYVMLYAQVNQPSGSTVIWVDDGFMSTGTAYYHGDHLGSARVMSDTGGNVIWSATYLPFGQEWNPQPTVNHYKFTGKERDSESGLDNFGARYDSSQYGRFMTPDWSSVPTPIPFADISYPQSLNLYSYARNNPLSKPDLDGHHTVCESDTYSSDKDGNLLVHAGVCHDVPDPRPQQSQSVFQQLGSWLSRARTSISRTGTSLAAILRMGSHGGPRAGRPFTRAGRQQVIRQNQDMNDGRTVCSGCGQETSSSQQSQAGVTPAGNETNVDHIYPRSQMGDGDPDTNGQVLCRACNLEKGDSLPDGVVEPAGALTVEPIEDPIIIDFLF